MIDCTKLNYKPWLTDKNGNPTPLMWRDEEWDAMRRANETLLRLCFEHIKQINEDKDRMEDEFNMAIWEACPM